MALATTKTTKTQTPQYRKQQLLQTVAFSFQFESHKLQQQKKTLLSRVEYTFTFTQW